MKFASKPVEEHAEVPLPDEGRWEDLVAHWRSRDTPVKAGSAPSNACYVVSVLLAGEQAEPNHKLAEIIGLVRGQGDRVVGQEILGLAKPDPRTFIGHGSCQRVAAQAKQLGADMVVVDAALSPSQQRNLEDIAGLAVCDREAVILNVFSRHAKTQAARIQVEIAHLEYLRPRIRGLGLDMDQQAGGVMRARGPGETASELMARRLDGRLAVLRRSFEKLKTAKQMQRRRRGMCKRIALVGYTNAGKTSLMNALTGAGLSARGMPFETLDTTARCLTRSRGDVVLTDTVGFIRRLPGRLLASFESTLAEVAEASLIALVVDLSDPEWRLQAQISADILTRIDAHPIPRLLVFNKVDRLLSTEAERRLQHVADRHDWIALSSRDADAVAQLKRRLIAEVRRDRQIARVFVAYEAPGLMAQVYANGDVLASEPKNHGLRLTIEAEPWLIERVRTASQQVGS